MEQEQEHVFVNAFLFLFPKCSLSVHEHGKERRTLGISTDSRRALFSNKKTTPVVGVSLLSGSWGHHRTSISFLFCLSLSFFVFLSVKPRGYGHLPSPTPSLSPRGLFNKTHLLSLQLVRGLIWAAALQTNINIEGRPLPTKKRWRTSSQACAPRLPHPCAPHFHIPVT